MPKKEEKVHLIKPKKRRDNRGQTKENKNKNWRRRIL